MKHEVEAIDWKGRKLTVTIESVSSEVDRLCRQAHKDLKRRSSTYQITKVDGKDAGGNIAIICW